MSSYRVAEEEGHFAVYGVVERLASFSKSLPNAQLEATMLADRLTAGYALTRIQSPFALAVMELILQYPKDLP